MEAAPSGRPVASPTTVVVGFDHGQTLAGPEWWERLAALGAGWWQRHPWLARRWARLRTVGLWLVLAGLLVMFALYPEFRAGLRIWLWLYGLLIAWFVVARTKTVSWRLVAGLFSVSVWWSPVIAAVSMWLSGRAGGVRGDGAGTVIAGMTEESLKLIPLAVLVLLVPGRVRRLAVVDWLLGFACGLAFQAFEELVQRGRRWRCGTPRPAGRTGPAVGQHRRHQPLSGWQHCWQLACSSPPPPPGRSDTRLPPHRSHGWPARWTRSATDGTASAPAARSPSASVWPR